MIARGVGSFLATAVLALASMLPPAAAQEAGWSYSPLPGEGDRAALGCDTHADSTTFFCLAVRCEDDGRLGIYAYASEAPHFVGRWRLQVDDTVHPVTGLPQWMSSPYSARIADPGDGFIERLVDDLIAGGAALMEFRTQGEYQGVPLTLSGTTRWVGGTRIACEPQRR